MPQLRLIIFQFLFSLFCLNTITAVGSDRVYVTAGGQFLVFEAGPGGKLTMRQSHDLGAAGPMVATADRRMVFVNTTTQIELKTGSTKFVQAASIATIQISDDGLAAAFSRSSSGMSAGDLRLSPDEKFLAGSNYAAGQVSIWKVDSKNGFQSERTAYLDLEQCSHSARFSPDGKNLFVPATTPNKIFQLTFDPLNGSILPNPKANFSDGPQAEAEAKQPRHLIFHPYKNIAYTTLERELPGVGVWRYNSETGTLATIENHVSIPQGERTDGMTTADLHLSPDARFLYVSNRDIKNQNKETGQSSIAVFKVHPGTGMLASVGSFPSVHIPRSFAIDSTGHYLFAGGQGDQKLGVYKLDPNTGMGTEIGRHHLPGKPAWVLAFPPPSKKIKPTASLSR